MFSCLKICSDSSTKKALEFLNSKVVYFFLVLRLDTRKCLLKSERAQKAMSICNQPYFFNQEETT